MPRFPPIRLFHKYPKTNGLTVISKPNVLIKLC